jgi:uncharacterized phiE125 gp8 family phage protein
MTLKVVTPPASEVVSLSEAKLHLRVTHDAEDAVILRGIKAARERTEHLTQRAIGTQTLELRLAGFPVAGAPLTLPMPPVTSVTSVTYRDAAGATQTLAPASYVLRDSEAGARLVLAPDVSAWPATDALDGAVVVTYAAGYTPSNVPASIVSFILLDLGTLYENRESMVTGVTATSLAFTERLLDRTKVWDI